MSAWICTYTELQVLSNDKRREKIHQNIEKAIIGVRKNMYRCNYRIVIAH